jgi:4-amino-4-deoxy-L-arabinose transferase-like glycosyltransferase
VDCPSGSRPQACAIIRRNLDNPSPLPAASTPHRARAWWVILLAAIVIWCGNLDYRKLSLSDEGRYSEIPRFMAQSGDWVTPRLNGIKYFEKPPLQYWTTAAAYRVFGEHNWTARSWPALTGLFGILFMYFVGARLFSRTVGVYAAAVLGSSVLYAGMGHILTLDMGLAFFLTVAYGSLLLALDPRAGAAQNRRWMLVCAAGCALAVLSKGLIGIVLPGAVVVLYMLVKRDLSLLRRLNIVSCAAVFLAICAPWFIAVSIANPEFAWFFFVHEHLQRYTTTIHQRYQPWYFFIPILLAGILPWLFTLFDALIHAVKRRDKRAAFDPVFFSLLWSAFIFVFFSASGSKLPFVHPADFSRARPADRAAPGNHRRPAFRLAARARCNAGGCRIVRCAVDAQARERQHSGRAVRRADAVALRGGRRFTRRHARRDLSWPA